MRTMFVLRGAPAAGKSTAIRELGLQHLAVGLDDLRRLFSASFTDLDGIPVLSMTNGAEKKVVAAYKEIVETRLRQGATLILDATNPSRRSYKEFAALARKCGYEVYVINAQEGLSDEELLARNETRRDALSYVSPEIVTSIAAKVREGEDSVTEPAATLSGIRALNTLTEIDAGAYERIVFIGDIQSCSGALAALKEHYGGWPQDTLFIFVGDLFDRGPDAAGVLDLIGTEPADNIVLIEGNHDEHLRHQVLGVPRSTWAQTRASHDQLLAAGYTRQDLNRLIARLVPAVALRFAGEHYLVTHAGLDATTIDRIAAQGPQGYSYDLTDIPMRQLLMGSSSRESTYLGRSDYDLSVEARLSHPRIVQVHGHRNGLRSQEPGPEEAAPNVYNLEHGVESGGHLSALEVDAAGRRTVLTFTQPAAPEQEARPDSLLARMMAHPEIRVLPVEGVEGIVACNFSRRAFSKGIWDETSAAARGLFLDRATSAVVARGYDKFFNIGEPHGPSTLAEVVSLGAGRPLTVRRKWNGFLAIVWAADGALHVFSKAGVTAYSRLAQDILAEHLGQRAAELATRIEQARVSLTFEVISRRDPHIVDEGPDKAVLLDAIRNQESFELDHALRDQVARDFGFVSPAVEVLSQAADDAALEALQERARRSEEEGDEGLVITFADGRMTKYKTRHYSEAKAFRGLLARHLAGREVRVAGRGGSWFSRYLDHGIPRDIMIEGVLGPVVDLPALLRLLSD